MNGLTILAIAIVALFFGYRGYAKWLEYTWGVDPKAKTPAQLNRVGGNGLFPFPSSHTTHRTGP